MDAIDFPDDLVQTQAAWNATYDALAAPRLRDTTALRYRLLRLSVRLWWHPYWETAPPRSTRSTRLRHRLHLAVALEVAPTVARPNGPPPRLRRPPPDLAVVGSLTSPLRPLCPSPLAGVKE